MSFGTHNVFIASTHKHVFPVYEVFNIVPW